jgi:hypothetical protein
MRQIMISGAAHQRLCLIAARLQLVNGRAHSFEEALDDLFAYVDELEDAA